MWSSGPTNRKSTFSAASIAFMVAEVGTPAWTILITASFVSTPRYFAQTSPALPGSRRNTWTFMLRSTGFLGAAGLFHLNQWNASGEQWAPERNQKITLLGSTFPPPSIRPHFHPECCRLAVELDRIPRLRLPNLRRRSACTRPAYDVRLGARYPPASNLIENRY
jgi:hypothetical protein